MPVNPLASDLSKSVRRRLSTFAGFAALVAIACPSATEAQSSFVRVHQEKSSNRFRLGVWR